MSDWLKYNPSSGYGNGTITITASTLTELTSRVKTIVAINEDYGLSASTIVRQTVPSENEYLTFDILSGGSIYWGCLRTTPTPVQADVKIIYYSKNGGEWTALTPKTGGTPYGEHIHVDAGDEIRFKGVNQCYSKGDNYIQQGSHFSDGLNTPTAVYNVRGNIMSLIYGDNFRNSTMIVSGNTFSKLFYGNNIIDASGLYLPTTNLKKRCYQQMFANCVNLRAAPELPATNLADKCYLSMFSNCWSLTTAPELPATTLSESCYGNMFEDCRSLTTTPALPATTLSDECYSQMFIGCTGLTTAPELPATTLTYGCYGNMFRGCTSLVTAPALPATTLANYCYNNMFLGCTSLTTAPVLSVKNLADYCYYQMFCNCSSLASAPALPATTLSNGCYSGMFDGCTSLVTAPELPATTLADECYYKMFNGCTNLNYIKCVATDISATFCTGGWVSGVSEKGTFVKNSIMEDWTIGNSGIPTNWVVVDYGYSITGIIISGLTWSTNVPASGGTADSGNCSYKVIAFYNNGASYDVTSQATVSGSQTVASSQITSAHTAGTLILTANYSGLSDSKSVIIYQDAYIPAAVTGISLNNLTWVTNIPAEGGIATSENCTYTVTAYYSDGTTSDITSQATVSGSQAVEASQITSAHTAGTLTLTASYNGYSASASTTIYQDAYVPITVTAITLDNLTWTTNVPASGGTATSANCSFNVIVHYSGGTTGDVTSQAVVNGSEVVPSSQITSAHTAGILTLTASYNGYSASASTTIYQDAYVPTVVTGISLNNLTWVTNIPASGGTATSANCLFNVIVHYSDGTTGDVTSQSTVSGSQSVPSSQITSAHTAGTLTLTASYSTFSTNGTVTIYQAAYQPSPTPTGTSEYLTFDILTGGTIYFKTNQRTFNPTIYYKKNDGSWVSKTPVTGSTSYVTVSAGDSIMFKSSFGGGYDNQYCYFSASTGTKFNVRGNVMSLVGGDNFSGLTSVGYCVLQCLFSGCTSVIDASQMLLPATTLGYACYRNMFFNCSALTEAPALPATTLANNCYQSMFEGCTSLTTAPELPATTLKERCYSSMFSNCTSLTTAPELPATTLANYCYNSMFWFCTSLNNVKCLATDITASNCTNYWLYQVSSTGIFIKNPNMSNWSTGDSGIPSGWTVQDAT